MRGEVDLTVGFVIEDACLLVVEVEQRRTVGLVLEERLVRAHDLGVLGEPGADARPQADDPFDTLGWQEAAAEDLLSALADAIDAACALDEADDAPREVVVHDDRTVLEVLALAEHVGRDEHPELPAPGALGSRMRVAIGAEPAGEAGGIR